MFSRQIARSGNCVNSPNSPNDRQGDWHGDGQLGDSCAVTVLPLRISLSIH